MQKTHKEIEILRAAEKLFTAYGYKKVSIDEIVKKAGIAKGTFYLYFKNKDEVYCRILEGYKTAAHKCIKTMVKQVTDLRTRLYIKFVGALHFFAKNKILKEIILENENYFSESITKEVIMAENIKHLKVVIGDDFAQIKKGFDLQDIFRVYAFFMNILRQEKNHSADNLLFYEKLGQVLVDGLLAKNQGEIQGAQEITQLISQINGCLQD